MCAALLPFSTVPLKCLKAIALISAMVILLRSPLFSLSFSRAAGAASMSLAVSRDETVGPNMSGWMVDVATTTKGHPEFSAELRMLRSLLQMDYSAALYGRTDAVNASVLQLVYLSLLPPAALRTIRDRIGLCTLTTGLTAPPAGDSSWRCVANPGCFPVCQASFAPGHLLVSPGHGDADPRDSVWLWPNALRAEPVPSHKWVEVSHCAISAGLQRQCGSKCGQGLMWFYRAVGSGVSLNVGRTVLIDEVDAMSALAVSGPVLSRAISHLKRERNSTLMLRLRRYLGLSDREVARLTTVQRTNHRESTCLPRKHEVILLLSPDDASYNRLSEASDIATAAAVLGPTRLQCGAHPSLFPCPVDHPALRLMAQCSASNTQPPRHSAEVRRHAGSCLTEHDESSGTTRADTGTAVKLRSGRHVAEPASGVLHAAWATTDSPDWESLVHETILAAQRLPSVQSVLFASGLAWRAIEGRRATHLWTDHRALTLAPSLRRFCPGYVAAADDGAKKGVLRPSVYVFKLSALMASPFERTLFLDSDVLLAHPSFVQHAFDEMAGYDYAAPISPSGFGLGPHGPRSAILRNASSPHPLLCSCMIAFRSSMRPRFESAAAGLLQKRHAELARQSDQEALWFELRQDHDAGRVRVWGLESELMVSSSRYEEKSSLSARYSRNNEQFL